MTDGAWTVLRQNIEIVLDGRAKQALDMLKTTGERIDVVKTGEYENGAVVLQVVIAPPAPLQEDGAVIV